MFFVFCLILNVSGSSATCNEKCFIVHWSWFLIRHRILPVSTFPWPSQSRHDTSRLTGVLCFQRFSLVPVSRLSLWLSLLGCACKGEIVNQSIVFPPFRHTIIRLDQQTTLRKATKSNKTHFTWVLRNILSCLWLTWCNATKAAIDCNFIWNVCFSFAEQSERFTVNKSESFAYKKYIYANGDALLTSTSSREFVATQNAFAFLLTCSA